MEKKRSIQREITEKIVQLIESGITPWRMPFTADSFCLLNGRKPHNLISNNAYSGINILLLWGATSEFDFKSNLWATYNQWESKGRIVKKGEKASKVVFFNIVPKLNATGELEEVFPYSKQFNVFNSAQIDGYQPEQIIDRTIFEKDERIEELIKSLGVSIHRSNGEAYYNSTHDYIGMPLIEDFIEDRYNQTLFHELIHWSASPKRLNRDVSSYAFEELVAELGSAFIASDMNIPIAFDDSAAYLDSWVSSMNKDPKYIFKAVSAASKAASYIQNLSKANLKELA